MDAALSMATTRTDSIAGRKVAVLAANDVDATTIETLRAALLAAGATLKVIAPHLGEIRSGTGKTLRVDHSLPTVGSVQFDAVYVPGGAKSVDELCKKAQALLFVKEAYKHGKPIAATDDGAMLIDKAARPSGNQGPAFQGPGVITASGKMANGDFVESFLASIAKHRITERPDLDAIVA
jgi:catalase